ncbi:hypothetical protein TIFTF001_034192 [Ficus carica]|uniref:Protein kinase domain-containing protein n=1 Tax=Ficus carica TaxID=3494 RepID=A0AA88J4U3_FICCA|nr:hypothetical protein TIFTF001_034192 [Ficus carica]
MSKLRSSKKDDDMKKNILGQPFVYVDDFTSIYSLEENIGYGRDVCAEKATGIKYSYFRLEKENFDDAIVRMELRRIVEIWEHTMKNKKKQQIYYPNNGILEFKAAYEDDDYVYLVIELCLEDDLDKWVNDINSGKELEAAYLFWQVLNAVHSFHSMGVMLRTLDHRCFWFLWPEDKGKLLNIKAFIPGDAVFMNEERNEEEYDIPMILSCILRLDPRLTGQAGEKSFESDRGKED